MTDSRRVASVAIVSLEDRHLALSIIGGRKNINKLPSASSTLETKQVQFKDSVETDERGS